MEVETIGDGKRRILFISGNKLIFVNYNEISEIPKIDAEYVISSDCHGDEETFEYPFTIDAKRIFLGDYYPYIPMYIKYRDQNKELIDYTYQKFKNMNSLLLKHKDDAIYLYGNHDPRIFPVSHTEIINGYKFVFQHSLIVKNPKTKELKHFYDKEEEKWKNETAELFGIEQTDKPSFTLLDNSEELEIPDADYIIVGHLSDYSKLEIPNLYTVDASNSKVVEYQRKVVNNLRQQRYERRISEIEKVIEELKMKEQTPKVIKQIKQQTELLEHFKSMNIET